ncbi:hypothetical protein FQZ97_678750 [compost metagenome]
MNDYLTQRLAQLTAGERDYLEFLAWAGLLIRREPQTEGNVRGQMERLLRAIDAGEAEPLLDLGGQP